MKWKAWLCVAVFVAAAGPALAADPLLTCEEALPLKIRVLPVDAAFKVLQNGYTERAPNGEWAKEYRPPPLDVFPDTNQLSTLRELIVEAYATASPFLKRRLCWLDYIFIDLNNYSDNPIGGWGFWERPEPDGFYERQRYPAGGPTERKFVGLSQAFLNSLQDLQTFEKTVADTQISNNDLRFRSSGGRLETLQAALAHEIAHIVWVMTPREVGGIEGKLRRCPAFVGSWNRAIARGPLLKTARNRQGNIPKPPPPSDVSGFLQQRRWASLFAAQDPAEDFAETYRLHAITVGNTLSLYIDQPVSVNLAADIRGSSTLLGAKRACIQQIDNDLGVAPLRRRAR